MLPMEKILTLLSEAVIVRNAVRQVNEDNDGVKWIAKERSEGVARQEERRYSSKGNLSAWMEKCKGRLLVVFAADSETLRTLSGKAKNVMEMRGRRGIKYWLVEYEC
jgi:hypothetical protein